MATLQQGSIVWAWMVDRRGYNRKLRAGIVITETEDIASAAALVVVAVASNADAEDIGPSFKLPWHRIGHPRTQLRQACYAICHWISVIRVDDIVDVGGYVSGKLLADILANVPKEFRAP
jgi:hypothetical protein